jgi:hypothetical protein
MIFLLWNRPNFLLRRRLMSHRAFLLSGRRGLGGTRLFRTNLSLLRDRANLLPLYLRGSRPFPLHLMLLDGTFLLDRAGLNGLFLPADRLLHSRGRYRSRFLALGVTQLILGGARNRLLYRTVFWNGS